LKIVPQNYLTFTGQPQAIARMPLQKAARAPPRLAGRRRDDKGGRRLWQRPRPSGWIDLKEISVKENRKAPAPTDGWHEGGRTREPRGSAGKIDAAKARRKAGTNEGRSSGDQT